MADVTDNSIKGFWKKYRIVIIAVIILLLIGFGIAMFVIYGKGQKNSGVSAGVRDVIATIPNPPGTGQYTQDELLQIGQLAASLEKNFSGFGWTYLCSNQPMIDTLAATDRVIKGVYLQYKQDLPTRDLVTDLQSCADWTFIGDDPIKDLINKLNELVFNS